MPYPKNIGMAVKIEKILKDKVVISFFIQICILVSFFLPETSFRITGNCRLIKNEYSKPESTTIWEASVFINLM